jgi:hypothetical protein
MPNLTRMKQPEQTVAIRLELPKAIHTKLKISAFYQEIGFKDYLLRVLTTASGRPLPKAKGAK